MWNVKKQNNGIDNETEILNSEESKNWFYEYDQ